MGDRHSRRSTPRGGLIVDFPSHPTCRPDRSSEESASTDDANRTLSSKPSRSVVFEPSYDLTIVAEDKSPSKSYSPEEIRTFRNDVVRDVRRLRHDLSTMLLDEDASHDRLYECVGLDRMINPTVLRQSSAAKRAHVVAVLNEQNSQWENDRVCEERLSLVAMIGSRSSRDRALRLAVGYSKFRE